MPTRSHTQPAEQVAFAVVEEVVTMEATVVVTVEVAPDMVVLEVTASAVAWMVGHVRAVTE